MGKPDLSFETVPDDPAEPSAAQIRDSILRATSIMAVAVNADGIITFFNAAAEKALGYAAAEIIGMETPMLWHDQSEVQAYADELSAEFGVAIEPGLEVFVKKARLFMIEEKEWTFVRKDGSRFPVLLSVDALRDDSGDIAGFLGVMHDISERKNTMIERDRLIAKLTASNAEFEHFAFVASHDMQEPLRAISSFSDLVATSCNDRLDDDGKLYLRLVREAATRMQTMVVDLLEYARAGRETERCENFQAAAEYEHALQNLVTSIGNEDSKIISGPLPQIGGDPAQFARLLQNLIGNGLKYHRPGVSPEIHVDAEDQGEAWLFCVRDNGIGIQAKDQAKIFEPFKRLHTRQEYAGTGLGLSVCKKIVENHAGKIWCRSTPQEGCAFYFTWPK